MPGKATAGTPTTAGAPATAGAPETSETPVAEGLSTTVGEAVRAGTPATARNLMFTAKRATARAGPNSHTKESWDKGTPTTAGLPKPVEIEY